MTQSVAKRGDRIIGEDIHVVLVNTPSGAVPTPTPTPFDGLLTGGLSSRVRVESEPVAVVGSDAPNATPHVAVGGSFQKPPTNRGSVVQGSARVLVEGKPIARDGDLAVTCNDPADLPGARVVAAGRVVAG